MTNEERAWAIRGWLQVAKVIDDELGPYDSADLEKQIWNEYWPDSQSVNPPDWLREEVRQRLEDRAT